MVGFWLFQSSRLLQTPVELLLYQGQVLVNGLLYSALRVEGRYLSIEVYVVLVLEL